MPRIKIGTIVIDTIESVKTITLGELRLKEKYTIELYTNEGDNIAHFHMVPENRKHKTVCVQLFEARYFPHGTNKDGTLNSDGCSTLNKWLNEECTLYENKKIIIIIGSLWFINGIKVIINLMQVMI